MKKLLLLSNPGWILATILIISGCNNSPASKDTLCIDCTDNFPGLEADKFLMGIARYRKYQWNASNTRIRAELQTDQEFEDARACWYSLDQLKEFICQIEKNKPDSAGELGIRFYYATYPETQSYTVVSEVGGFPRTTEVKAGMRHTLFMVPTIQDKELNIDFITPLETGTERRPVTKANLKFLTDSAWQAHMITNTRLLVLGGVLKSDVTGKNQSMLCPPTCPVEPGSPIRTADSIYPDSVVTKN